MISGTLRVDILDEGVHSGDASGIVPSSFRIVRQLLSRIDDEMTGAVQVASANVDIPADRVTQAGVAAQNLGDLVWRKFPFVDAAQAVGSDLAELVLNRTWRPALSITGQSGMPDLGNAGNVLRPGTYLALSLRIPPTADSGAIIEDLRKVLTADPPYGAHVTVDFDTAADGWNAPPLAEWLEVRDGCRLANLFRQAGRLHGRGRHHPLHGNAGGEVPGSRSSSSQGCWGPPPTPTARTSSCTFRPARS